MDAALLPQSLEQMLGATSPAVQFVRANRQGTTRCTGLVIAANRTHRMAVVRVDTSGGYSVVRWSEGNGPRVGEQLMGNLEKAGAGPLLEETTGADVHVLVVAHHYPLNEAIEAID